MIKINDNKGIALMMTLWALVLLSVLAMSFVFSVRFGNASTRNFKEDTEAYYLALSAYEEAVAYILSDKDPTIDYIDENGAFRTDSERQPVSGKKTVGSNIVDIRITDEESRLNINTISTERFKSLFKYAKVSDDDVLTMIDSLADWRDPDKLARPLGAEADYYKDYGYDAKNNRVEVVEELLVIRGFKPEHLYGTEKNPAVYPLLTVWGDGLNINTVSEELLRAMEFSEIEIDKVLSQRSNHGPMKSMPLGISGFSNFASRHIRIDTRAWNEKSPLAVKITAIIDRSDNPEHVMKVLYWKEEIENSGA